MTTTPTTELYTTYVDQRKPITLLLKGEPGKGKTYKMAQLPDLVIFNFDNNLSCLRKLPQALTSKIRIVNPRMRNGKELPAANVWDNFVALLTKVLADNSVKNVGIDSLTTLQDLLCHKILKTDSPTVAMQIQHWGEMKRYLTWLADQVLLANDLDKNVIINAHEKLIEDSLTQSITYTLNLSGSMKTSFDLYFTDCWRCYTKPGKDGRPEYRVRTLPGSNFNAKCSLDVPMDFKWDDEADKVVAQFTGNI